ncbi:MAG: primosomal protein N' [Candidatus Portnoybacteria bacterium]|nr:primosomal protein N' [Candidatus Portnoybacteria bacterium]
MYIIEVVPLTKIPIQQSQVLSYFSAHELLVGSLVLIPLSRRQEEAVVIETHQISSHRIEVKRAEYELRPIKKVLTIEPILTHQQIELAMWLGQYYFTPPGAFMKMAIKNRKNVISSSAPQSAGRNEGSLAYARRKSQKLILAPTISQVLSIVEKCDEEKITTIHSGLTKKQLSENWQKIAKSQAKIIIGTRLAVFAPFLNLKEIIVKDETNPSHRSWDMHPHYRVHEAAQKLAEIFGAKIILKSNLPSIESYFLNALPPLEKEGWGGFEKIDFSQKNPPQSPFSKGGNQEAQIVDLRQELKEGNYSIFSRQLQKSINEALKNKQQIILFINRRGAATFVLCRDCGYVAKCPNCDAPLTYHFERNNSGFKPILICHHCGHKESPPTLCPKCQGIRIKAFGSGTQRVEIEAQKLFSAQGGPHSAEKPKILRLDSDTAPTSKEQTKIIEEFKEKKGNILIGTQMMLNDSSIKAGVVAIISADTLLHLPDFGSDERTFQTINQLRALSISHFFIQTYNPQSKIIQLAAQGDFKSFYQQEIETRQALKYPPFSQLIKLIFRHKDPKKSATEAKILFAKLTQQLKTSRISKEVIFEITGPSPAFISKEKGKYIWQIVIKSAPVWLAKREERTEILKKRNQFLILVPPNWEIDIDPETLL